MIKRFDLKRKLKFFWQRKTRGFSDRETWSLYSGIAKFTLPRLKKFRELHFDSLPDLDFNQWNKALDDMIFAMQYCVDQDNLSESPTKKDCIRIKRGLRLFGKYFMDLWW